MRNVTKRQRGGSVTPVAITIDQAAMGPLALEIQSNLRGEGIPTRWAENQSFRGNYSNAANDASSVHSTGGGWTPSSRRIRSTQSVVCFGKWAVTRPESRAEIGRI